MNRFDPKPSGAIRRFLPLLGLLFLFSGCLSPRTKLAATVPSRSYVVDLQGVTADLPSYSIGNTVYTPKFGYQFTAVFFKIRGTDRFITLQKDQFQLVSTDRKEYLPQFYSVGPLISLNADAKFEVHLIYVVPIKSRSKYFLLPNGVTIDLEDFLK